MSPLDLAISKCILEHAYRVAQIKQKPSQVGWLVGKVMLEGSFGSYGYVEGRVKQRLGIA